MHVCRALSLLCNLATHAPGHPALMAVVDVVRPVMVAHSGCTYVVGGALSLLSKLASHPANQVPLMAYAGLVRVIAQPRYGPDSEGAVCALAGLCFLASLAACPANQGPLVVYADLAQPALLPRSRRAPSGAGGARASLAGGTQLVDIAVVLLYHLSSTKANLPLLRSNTGLVETVRVATTGDGTRILQRLLLKRLVDTTCCVS